MLHRSLEELTAGRKNILDESFITMTVNSILRMLGHCNCGSAKNIDELIAEACKNELKKKVDQVCNIYELLHSGN